MRAFGYLCIAFLWVFSVNAIHQVRYSDTSCQTKIACHDFICNNACSEISDSPASITCSATNTSVSGTVFAEKSCGGTGTVFQSSIGGCNKGNDSSDKFLLGTCSGVFLVMSVFHCAILLCIIVLLL